MTGLPQLRPATGTLVLLCPLFTVWLLTLAGCGLGSEAGEDCRCAPKTDVTAFPHCRGVPLDEEIESSNPFSTRQPECPSGQLLFGQFGNFMCFHMWSQVQTQFVTIGLELGYIRVDNIKIDHH